MRGVDYHGLTVIVHYEASDVEEALMKIETRHPDIVIVDVWLSKLDGIGVIRRAQGLS